MILSKILMIILQVLAVVITHYSLNNVFITFGIAIILILVAWYVLLLPSKVPNT